MANWKLTKDVRSRANSHLRVLLDRRAAYVELACPLTLDDFRPLLVPDPKDRELFAQMIARGHKNLLTYTESTAYQIPAMEGVSFNTEVAIIFGEGLLCTKYEPFYGTGMGGRYRASSNKRKIFPLATLSDERRVQFIDWLKRALDEVRLREKIIDGVATFMEECLPTAAHVQVRWPTAALLIAGSDPRGAWRDRLNARVPARSTRLYGWEGASPLELEIRAQTAKALAAAEVVIAGASMMPDPPRLAPDRVRGMVSGWERVTA